MDHPFLIVREEDYAALRARLEDLAATRARSSGWSANVPVGDTLFAAILALDVVYYELGSDIRAAVVDRIDRLVRSLDPNGWTIGYYAVRGTWALFQGDRDTFERYKKAYRDELFTDHIFPDGVYSSAPGYALARFAGVDREQKNLFMDILEFTGEDTYYSRSRIEMTGRPVPWAPAAREYQTLLLDASEWEYMWIEIMASPDSYERPVWSSDVQAILTGLIRTVARGEQAIGPALESAHAQMQAILAAGR